MEAEIQEEVRAALRGVLAAPEAEWRGLLQPVMDRLADGLLDLVRVRAFLVQHLDAAGERFRSRLEGMILLVEQAIRTAAQDGSTVDGVAAELLALRAQRAQLQAEIDLRRDLIELAVGHGQKLEAGAHRVSVSTPGVSLRVVDAGQVPALFLSPQPDRKAILAHFVATGEVLPGTELGTRRAAVTVKPSGA